MASINTPAVIRIKLHTNHPWNGWAAEVWCDDTLRTTGYGDYKEDAIAKARGGFRMYALFTRIQKNPRSAYKHRNTLLDIQINNELSELLAGQRDY